MYEALELLRPATPRAAAPQNSSGGGGGGGGGGRVSPLGPKYKFPTEGCAAIDVGAAPGGWSHQLLKRAEADLVLAIDPADLDPALLAHPSWVRPLQHSRQLRPAQDGLSRPPPPPSVYARASFRRH